MEKMKIRITSTAKKTVEKYGLKPALTRYIKHFKQVFNLDLDSNTMFLSTENRYEFNISIYANKEVSLFRFEYSGNTLLIKGQDTRFSQYFN